MADIIISLDPGASLSKVIYMASGNDTHELLVMQPETIVVPTSSIENYQATRLGVPTPEAEAWGVVDGECFVVGTLAREFLADAGMREVKYEKAVYKVLAAIGAIKQIHSLPAKLSVSLSVLLPWNEYPDRDRFRIYLVAKLKDYTFRGERLRVKLSHFECFPEGSGLAMSRVKTKGKEWFRERTIAIVMFGHRNTSALVFLEGKLNILHTTTTELGFHQLVDMVARRTSGQDLNALTEAIFRAGSSITPTNPDLVRLARSKDELNRSQEIEQIVSAIAQVRTEYWRRLSAWLDITLSGVNVSEVILGGGGAHYFKRELLEHFAHTPTYWGDELMHQVPSTFFSSGDNTALAFRLLDVFGYFLYLKATLQETLSA